MLHLVATFENSEGNYHQLSFPDPDMTKTPEEIRATLEIMTTLNFFGKDGVKQFQKVVGAKYVETIETPIFKVDENGPIIECPEEEETSSQKSNQVVNRSYSIHATRKGKDGTKKLEIVIPDNIDTSSLSEKELETLFFSCSPEDSVIGKHARTEKPKESKKEPTNPPNTSGRKRRTKKTNRKLLERFDKHKTS